VRSEGTPRTQRLRTIFCTRGGLFGALVFRRLLACDQIEIVGIVRSSRVMSPRYGFVKGALALMRRSGLAYTLYMLCATTLSDGLCALLGPGAVPLWTGAPYGRASGSKIPVHTTRDIHDSRGMRFLRGCAPDLLVSAFFDQRLKDAVLALPAHGCLNIHPSLLPSFGGVDPVLQARLRGGALGVTVHRMTAVLDGGEILSQHEVDVPAVASVFEGTARLFDVGAALLALWIKQLQVGEPGTPQPSGGSYQSWPTPNEVRALREHGTAMVRLYDLWQLMRQYADASRDDPAPPEHE
jgi:methionyl-tRNA formyltransferase